MRFQKSFCPMGITASLVSGMPRRDTCTQEPEKLGSLSAESVLTAGRLAEAHTPIT